MTTKYLTKKSYQFSYNQNNKILIFFVSFFFRNSNIIHSRLRRIFIEEFGVERQDFSNCNGEFLELEFFCNSD